MSKRIIKIWSIMLTVALIGSMMVFAVPVSADYGNMQWSLQPIPTATSMILANGTDVTDIAVNGETVYVVDNTAATGLVYKSTNGGKTFAVATSPANITLTMVGVASDNPEVVIVASAAQVWISTNGGTTWSQLPALLATSLNSTITDVGVGPARTGTLLGRDYAVTVADPANNADDTAAQQGDVLIIGTSGAWLSAGAITGITGTHDYMALAFTPNFVGDRTLVVLGVQEGASGTAFADVQVINTATSTVIVTTNVLVTGRTTTDFQTVGATTNVVKAEISLPSDFDASTPGGRRSYVGFAAAATFTDNDVYRVDNDTSRALGGVSGAQVWSVAYAGTVDLGTLFVGRATAMTEGIRYTKDPTSNSPTWVSTKKLVPITSASAVVRTAPDFAKSSKVYAGTSGAESAFSISVDAGVSFNGKSLIDNGVGNTTVAIQGISLLADGKTAFLNTDDGTDLSLWKGPAPPTADSWERIWVVAGTAGAFRTSPDYATTSTLYLFDIAVSGSIYRSTDGGATFSTRLGPTGITIGVASMAIKDANTLWVTDNTAAPSLYKSTTGGWTWDTPVAITPSPGTVVMTGIPKPDALLIGGTGFIVYSFDAGATFTRIDGPNAAETYRFAASPTFATDNTFFASDATATTGNTYRYTIGKDTSLVNLAAPNIGALQTRGLHLRGGVLYTAYATNVARTLRPFEAPGTQEWDTMNMPAAPILAAVGSAASAPTNTYWMREADTDLWAYNDYLAAAKPTLKAPGDKATVSVDPVTGRADLVNIAMEPMGTGTALVNQYEVQITVKGEGWEAATLSGAVNATNPASPSLTMGPPAIVPAPPAGFQFTLRANTAYEYRVRAFNEVSGDLIRSPWSDTRSLTVQAGTLVVQQQYGTQLLGPAGGAQGVSLKPGFSWAPIYGATKYQFILATDAALTKRVAGTPVSTAIPSFQPAADLEYGTSYFWSVQVTEPSVGAVSVGTFTTMAKPAPPPPPPITIAAPLPPAPVVTPIITVPPPVIPPAQYITPAYIWAIIAIGAILVIAVIVLISRTRRPG